MLRVIVVIGITALISACGVGATPSSHTGGVSTIVAGTLQALTANAPPPPGVPVSYANVSFGIPPGVATGASSQTVAAADAQHGGPWAAAPQHTEFALIGYGLPPGFFSTILIEVYPAQEYAAANKGADISLQRLRTFLSNPSSPRTNDTMPPVPFFMGGPMFLAQVQVVKFAHGSGVRMITQYGEGPGEAGNSATFYHFQGLTDDGKFYIIAVLPIQAPFLLGADPSSPLPAGGIPFPGHSATEQSLDNYYKAVADKLNATAAEDFHPGLTALDALIQSLRVSP